MVEDALLEGSQLGSGLEPKLVVERLTASAIDLERLRLPSAAVERDHQLPAQPLTVGVQSDERLELADQSSMLSAYEIRLDAVLERAVPGLFQPCDLPCGERLVRQIGERFAAPELERRAQQLAGASSVAARERSARLSGEPLEALGVDLSRFCREHVAATPRHQHVLTKRPAQV